MCAHVCTCMCVLIYMCVCACVLECVRVLVCMPVRQREEVEKQQERWVEGPWGSIGEGGGGARESRGAELGMSHRAGGTGPCGPQPGLTGCSGQSSCLAPEEVSLRPGGSWAPEQLLALQPRVLLWPTGQGWVPAPVCPSAEGPCAQHTQLHSGGGKPGHLACRTQG